MQNVQGKFWAVWKDHGGAAPQKQHETKRMANDFCTKFKLEE